MKHMNRFLRSLGFALAVCLSAVPAFAQVTTTTTTLTNAVTSPAANNQTATTSIVLASLTNVQVGGEIYTDSEAMCVLAVPAAATSPITVIRGCDGTAAASHAANTLVWVATPTQIQAGILRHVDKSGSCTPSLEAALPQVNVNNGNVQNCNPYTLSSGGVPTAWQWGGYSQTLDWPNASVTLVSDANYFTIPSDTFVIYQTLTANRVVQITAMSIPGKTLTISNNCQCPFTVSVNGLIAGSTTYSLAAGTSATPLTQTIRMVWSGLRWFTY